MRRSLPKDKQIGRSSWKKKAKLKVYVVCEGAITEPEYLKNFAREFGNGLVEVEAIGPSGVPLTIVDKCIDLSRQLKRRAKDSFDEELVVWGLLDVDEHPLAEAVIKARDNDIPLAISNPCFEVWALIHLKDHNRYLHRHDLQRLLNQEMPKYHHSRNPVFDYTLMYGKYEDAKARALRMARLREEEGNKGGNPSTTVFKLLDVIVTNGKSKPQPG